MAERTEVAQLDILVNGEQAAGELQELEEHARLLAKQIDNARNKGEHAFAGQLTKNLKELNGKTKQLKGELTDVSKVLDNLSSSNLKQLRQALTLLQTKLNASAVKRGSEQWKYYQESIRKVREEINAIANESMAAESRLSRLTNGFNKYFTVVTTFLASITGLSLAFRKLSEENAKMDDTYSDVMKTTQMTKDEVLALNEELKKIDTRTAREELNRIAEEGGRIGLAKEDILEFTNAMNIANVALGDSFKGGVEEIAATLGKLKFLFEETKDMGVDKAYMAIGSAINELGANGIASEANIANFATRVGALPAALKPSIASTLALGAAFEESGIEAEVSSRAYNIFLKQAANEAGKFAEVMRISAREVEDMINKDPLEFFLDFAEGLRGMDATEVAKTLSFLGVNADGANKALGAAANQTEHFRELILLANDAFADGTSILDEYAIKNNNAAAKLEKSRKAFKEAALELGERLNPALLKSTDLTTYIVKILPDLIDWFGNYGGVLLKVSVAMAAYTLVVKAHIVEQKMVAFWNNVIIASTTKLWALMINNPWGVVIGAVTLAISLYQAWSKQLTVAEQKQNALNEVNETARKSITREIVTLERLLDVANDLTRSKEERLLAIAKINEIAPLYLGNLSLEEIATNKAKEAIDRYKNSLLQAATAMTAFNKIAALNEQKIELQSKTAEQIYMDNTTWFDRFRVDINLGFGDVDFFQQTVSMAQSKHEAAIQAVDEQIESLEKIANQAVMADVQIHTSIAQGSTKVENGIEYVYRNGQWVASYRIPGGENKAGSENKALTLALKNEEERYNQQKADLKKRYAERLENEESFNRKLEEIETEHLQKEKAITEEHGDNSAHIQDKIYDRMIKRANEEKELLDRLSLMYEQFDLKAADRDKIELIRIAQKFDAAKRLLEDGLNKQFLSRVQYEDLIEQLIEKRGEAQEKALREADAKLAAEEMKKMDVQKAVEEAFVAEQHRKGLISEGAYKEQLLRLEEDFLKKKLALAGLAPQQKDEINRNLSLKQADIHDLKRNERDDTLEKYNLVDSKERLEDEYLIIADFEARGVLSHQEAAEAKALIDQEYLETLTGRLNEVNTKIQGVSSDLASAMAGFLQAEEEAVSRKFNKQIAAAEGNAAKQKKLEEKKEKELNAIRAKYADKQFIVKAASVAASTAVAAMEAYAAMAGIPYVGPALGILAAAAAVSFGAAQIAAAKQERDNAKEGYFQGGFTPSGPWDEPQGFVHSDEFVANRFALRNPVTRKVFNIVDEAQRNNTVSALTEKDFARALDYREAENRSTVAGLAGTLATQTPTGVESAEMYARMLVWIQRNAELSEQLNRRLEEPFVGEVYIDGPRGVKKNLDDYNQLISNASR